MPPTAAVSPASRVDPRAEAIVACMDSLRRRASFLGLRGADADEAVQQTLLHAWSRRDELDFERPLAPYLQQVVALEAKKLRAVRRRAPDVRRLRVVAAADPSDDACRRELREGLGALIERLPAAQRRVLRLRLQDGMEPHEIAARLACEPGAVRVSLHRGLVRLRELLPRGFAMPAFTWLRPFHAAWGAGAPSASRWLATLAAAAGLLITVVVTALLLGAPQVAMQREVRGVSSPDTRTSERSSLATGGHLSWTVSAAAGGVVTGGEQPSAEHGETPAAAGSEPSPMTQPAPFAPLADGAWAERYHAAVAPIPGGGVMLFGGLPQRGRPFGLGDTWVLRDGQASPVVGLAPSPRSHASIVLDVARDEVVLFGGRQGRFDLDDTWLFDGQVWRRAEPRTRPAARHFAGFVYDGRRQLAVLHGGTHGAEQQRTDTWTWDGADWRPQPSAVQPPARRMAAVAFDDVRGVAVLYGGIDARARPHRDTWELGDDGWREVATAIDPGARSWHAMAFDPALGAVVLHGGLGGARAAPRGDTWLFDGCCWEPAAGRSPGPRAGHALVHDRATDRLLAIGNVAWSSRRPSCVAACEAERAAAEPSVEVLLWRRDDGRGAAQHVADDGAFGAPLLDAEACSLHLTDGTTPNGVAQTLVQRVTWSPSGLRVGPTLRR